MTAKKITKSGVGGSPAREIRAALRLAALTAIVTIPSNALAQAGPVPSAHPLRPGFFNIYMSMNVESAYGDPMNATIARLAACGIAAEGDMTFRYKGMTRGLAVVLSGPFASKAAAARQLAAARACGVSGYSKHSVRDRSE